MEQGQGDVAEPDRAARAHRSQSGPAAAALGPWGNRRRLIDEHAGQCREQELPGDRFLSSHFRLLAEGMPQMVWSARAEGVTDYCNARLLDYVGVTWQQLPLWDWASALHPDDAPSSIDAWQEASRTGAEYRREQRIRRASDGQYRWHLSHALPLRDAGGHILRWFGTCTDIDDHKEAEQRLRAASDRLTLAAAAANVGIWDRDLVNDALLWDDTMFRLYGVTRAQFGGSFEAWKALIHPEDLPQADEQVQRALRGQSAYDNEFRVVWPDKSIHFIKAHAVVQRDAAGNPVRLLGTNWDITELRLAERELQKSRRQLERRVRERTADLTNANAALRREIKQHQRSLAELAVREAALAMAGNGFCFRDLKGHIFYCNDAFCKMWGFADIKDAIGTHVSELWADPQSYQDALAELMQNGSFVGELKARRRDATVFDAQVRASLASDEHGRKMSVTSILDLTEVKQAQDAMQRSIRLLTETEKLAATGRMAARIAHEINNPLAGIKNAFRLFKDAIPPECPERKYLERTQKEIDRIARIVRELYDLHRPNQEQETHASVDEILSEVAMTLESLSRQHAVRLEIAQPMPALRVLVPEGAIRQIVISLAANAIEASPANGVVEMGRSGAR